MYRATMIRVAACLVVILVSVASLELFTQVVFRFQHGYWLYSSIHHPAFREHPWLVGVPREGTRMAQGHVTITHNSMGFRGSEVSARKACGKRRIAAIGGSTTYGTRVSDQDTWPYLP